MTMLRKLYIIFVPERHFCGVSLNDFEEFHVANFDIGIFCDISLGVVNYQI